MIHKLPSSKIEWHVINHPIDDKPRNLSRVMIVGNDESLLAGWFENGKFKSYDKVVTIPTKYIFAWSYFPGEGRM